MVKVDVERCIGCGKCEKMCPAQAIRVVNKKAQVNHSLCTGCGSCVRVCPVQALSLEVPADGFVVPKRGCGFRGGRRRRGWRGRCRRSWGW